MSAHVYGAPQPDIASYMRAQALSRIGGALGADARNIAWLFDDMLEARGDVLTVPVGWDLGLGGTSGAAAMATINNEGGGWSELTSGATGSSSATSRTQAPAIRRPDTSPFYCAIRQKLTTAVTANTNAWGGLQNVAANKTIAMGVIGPLHATNFIVQYDGATAGSFVNLTVAADTNAHIFEIWGVGDGKLHCAIDFGADLGNVSMAAAPTDSCYGIRQAYNGADAAARTIRADWFAVMTSRT